MTRPALLDGQHVEADVCVIGAGLVCGCCAMCVYVFSCECCECVYAYVCISACVCESYSRMCEGVSMDVFGCSVPVCFEQD